MTWLLVRAIAAFLAFPGVVAFVVPIVAVSLDPVPAAYQFAGAPPTAIGTALLLWCVREFYVAGRGTLAPWAPPRALVTSGPYRVSRNPMYVAVALILTGWAVGFRSMGLGVYAACIVIAFHLRIVRGEEPWLARTFGDEWARYRAATPRWVGLARGREAGRPRSSATPRG